MKGLEAAAAPVNIWKLHHFCGQINADYTEIRDLPVKVFNPGGAGGSRAVTQVPGGQSPAGF